jgi:hypothetical protein
VVGRIQVSPTESNIPVPDPSLLTTEQLRRELSALKEVLETRISGLENLVEVMIHRLDNVPAESEHRIDNLRKLHDERFTSVALQFAERDTRSRAAETAAKDATQALSVASTTAVNAALQAQKESAFATQQFSAEAIKKSEAGFTNEINSLKSLINATKDGLITSIGDLRSRLDRGEGGQTASRDQRYEGHKTVSDVGVYFAIGLGVLSLIAVLVFGVMERQASPTQVVAPAVVPLQK